MVDLGGPGQTPKTGLSALERMREKKVGVRRGPGTWRLPVRSVNRNGPEMVATGGEARR